MVIINLGPAYKNLITNNMICATTSSQTTDACLGDSGGIDFYSLNIHAKV
jgi:hypothetical protein